MKSHITKAGEAFVALLTALVAIYTSIRNGDGFDADTDEGVAAEKPATKKPTKKATKKTAKKQKEEEEEEEPNETEDEDDEDDILGGGEEDEEEITMSDLKKKGQAVIKAGNADGLKKILKKHKAENLGGLDEGSYATVAKELDKLIG